VIFSLLLSTTLLSGAVTPETMPQVLLCGVCRNVEPRLERTKIIMESIGNLFQDYRILVYENNSTDHTAERLFLWAQENPKVWIKSEHLSREQCEQIFINTHQDGSFFISEKIARARNIVLKEALSEQYKNFPYLIWVDMDFVLAPDLSGFLDTFQTDQEWDAVFAYGIDPYHEFWDWYALRDENYPLGSELLGMDWWYMPKYLILSKTDPWYPVYSAFGGCGIYKKSSLEGCSYSGIVTRDLEIHAKKVIEEGKKRSHPQIVKFLRFCSDLEAIHKIEKPSPNLPFILNPNHGVVLHDDPGALLWKMSSFVYQYPSVCEHVPLHASMIVHGHGKLFINPRLIFRYGD
jgi:hypothetical protein